MLLLWSSFLFIYGIHQGDLYRTEGLRAIVGAEMYQSGDWVVPRLYGEPILTKPPFFYWCIAAIGGVFGEVTAWSARLPSAIAGCVSVLLVYFIMRRYYGAKWGLLSALALPCSFLWLDKGSSAEIDAVLVLWVIGACGCFLRVMERKQTADSRQQVVGDEFGWWVAALLCVAGGVMTKWTGFLFFYVMVIPFLIWRRQLGMLFRWQHLVAAAIGAGVVWIWLGMVIEELGWSYVWSVLWREGAPRVLAGKSPHQQLLMETLLHPFKVFAICFPWSLLALYGMGRKLRTWNFSCGSPLPYSRGSSPDLAEARNLVEGSLLCWAIAGTAMMTLFPDHNTRQSFALVPAWTLLGVLQIHKWMTSNLTLATRRNYFKLGWTALLLWCMVKIAYVEVLVPARYRERPGLSEQAEVMREFVPKGETLYLQAVKDECLMFTYGQTVRRVKSWNEFSTTPSGVAYPVRDRHVVYCILTQNERDAWPRALRDRIEREKSILDAQGDSLILVRLLHSPSP